MTTDEIIQRLLMIEAYRGLQGSETALFVAAANRLEALSSFCHEIAENTNDHVSSGVQNKARLVVLLNTP